MSLSRLCIVLSLAATLAACDAVAPANADADVARIGSDGQVAYAQAAKVAVCHATGSGGYQRIEVSSNARDAHLGHGDGLVGGDAPGGGTFDDACEIVQEPALTSCTFGTSEDPELGTLTTIRLDVLDTTAIRTFDVGLRVFDGLQPNIVSFDVQYEDESREVVVSATAVLAPRADGPYRSAIDLLDNDGEEELGFCGPVTVG